MVDSSTLVVAYFIASLLPLVLIPPTVRSRDKPGATGLGLVALSGALWSFGSGLVVASPGELLGFIGIICTPLAASLMNIGYLLTVVEYTGTISLSRRVLGLLAIEPTVMLLLSVSNPLHHLVFRAGIDMTTFQDVSQSYVGYFWIHTAIVYGLFFVAIALLVQEVLHSRNIRRKQSLMLLTAGFPPAITATYYTFVGGIGFNPTPFGVILSVFILAWALLRAQFLDIVPIAREQAMEEMDDLVVTLDGQGRVVDCNPAAREFVGVGPNYVGMDGREFFTAFPEMVAEYGDVHDANTEASVAKHGQQYHFDINITSIQSGRGQQAGRVFVFRDITAQKQREQELRQREQRLREREQRLDLSRQVLSRVLRHNIRNELQAVKLVTNSVRGDLEKANRAKITEAEKRADKLLSISEKARDFDRVIEEEQTVQSMDLTATLSEIVETARVDFPDVTFTLDCPDPCQVETIPSVGLVFENLVENAAEHNTGDSPAVTVVIVENPREIAVMISDNGPGIPEHELVVLRDGEETALKHGSGVGLWLINWVIDNAEAAIEYDTADNGTTVTVRIPLTDHDETEPD